MTSPAGGPEAAVDFRNMEGRSGNGAPYENPHLLLRTPDGEEHSFSLVDGTLTIGRRSSNEVQVLDATVSREHARIVFEDGRCWLEDLGSTHGTRVNGEPVERRALEPGDSIRIGQASLYRLVFRGGGSTDETFETQLARISSELSDGTAEGSGNLRLLLDIARTLNSSLRLDDVLDKVMDAVMALTRADRGMLLLGDDAENLNVRVQRNFDGDEAPRYSHSVVDEVFETCRSRLLLDATEDERYAARQSIVDLDLRTVMCAPLPLPHMTSGEAGLTEEEREEENERAATSGGAGTDEHIVGVVYVDRRSPTRHFTDQDLELFESLAGHAAIAIHNARLYGEAIEKRRLDEELEVARRIQKSLLPSQFPELPWVEVSGMNIPTRGVGGDYFEVLEAGDDTVDFAIGDVAGKGIPAALLMSTLQSSYVAALSTHAELGDLCGHVNRFLVGRTGPERYATFFAGRVHDDGRLDWVSAGHNPQLLLHDGEVTQLSACGLPLGMFDHAEYPTRQTELQPGDLLVCFTDGITEANSVDEEEFGEERLLEVIRGHADEPVEELLHSILSAVERHTAGVTRQFDDLTLLALRLR